MLDIIHLCDVMATSGYLKNMERGPGRHGISNAFFLYIRDPDGHRVELFSSDYLTVDPDHAPIRWSLTDPRRQTLWGQPAPASWFKEGSVFAGRRASASRCWKHGRSWRHREAGNKRRDGHFTRCGTPIITAATIAQSAKPAAITSAMRTPPMKSAGAAKQRAKERDAETLPVCRIALRTPEATPEYCLVTLPSNVDVIGGTSRPSPPPRPTSCAHSNA